MALTIKMEVTGDDKADNVVTDVRELTQDFTPLWDDIIKELAAAVGIVFQTDGFGKWPPRKDNLPHPLLRKSLTLQKSLREKGDNVVIQKRPTELIWGSLVPYHDVHEYGTTHIPPRPILEMVAPDEKVHARIGKIIEKRIEKLIQGHNKAS